MHKIEITESVDPETGCIYCTSHKLHNGRSLFMRNGKLYSFPRYKYEQKFGPIPENHVITHDCNNSNCGNPNHMTLLTKEDFYLIAGHEYVHTEEAIIKRMLYCLSMNNLTVDLVREIYQISANVSNSEISRKYNIKSDVVANIRHGRTYKTLTHDLKSPIIGSGIKNGNVPVNRFRYNNTD